ncbi:MAG TPA: hypothetical protein PLZ86_02825 [bacterium]|nr:hypothetical protein [bacterium]
MKDKRQGVILAEEGMQSYGSSPIDLMRRQRGASRRLREEGKPQPDSMLAVMADRATYTFIMEDGVASIHFDRRRGEIFFRGHKIGNMEISKAQVAALHHMEEVLKADSRARELFPAYSATLARCLADK